MPVRRQDIQLKATELISPDSPGFKAFNGWVDKFMHRHSLSLRFAGDHNYTQVMHAHDVLILYRAKTSIQQRLPAQLETKLEKFISNVKVL